MDDPKLVSVGCPYCGETIRVEIDPSVERQEYVEDCHVCCRPIELAVVVNARGNARVTASREDD